MRSVSPALVWLLLVAGAPAAQLAASRQFTCATCHRDEAQFQPKTPMGIGLELPPDQVLLKANPKMAFEAKNFSYVVERKGDVSTYTVTNGTDSLTLPIHYAFGVKMQTFVLEHDGHLYESLVSYYPAVKGLALTMGDERLQPHNVVEAMGREMPNQEITRCFGCHSTGAVVAGQFHPESLKPGLACEVCHTGAAAHMEGLATGKAAPTPKRLGQMTAEETSNFCGNCHRSWESVVRMRTWGTVNVRFQPYRLANSRCFLGSDSRISCTGCHNPHHDLATDEAGYDKKCLACHGNASSAHLAKVSANASANASPQPKSCPIAKDKCVSCHMPKIELPGSHSLFTDHDIRVVRAGEPYPN